MYENLPIEASEFASKFAFTNSRRPILNTQYKKHPLHKMNITFSPQTNSNGNDLVTTILITANYSNSNQAKLIRNKTTLGELQPYAIGVIVKNVENNEEILQCIMYKNEGKTTCGDACRICQDPNLYNDYEYLCAMKNVEPNNYSIYIIVFDERCDTANIFQSDFNCINGCDTSPCSWSTETELGKIEAHSLAVTNLYESHSEQSNHATLYIAVSGIIILLLISLFILLGRYFRIGGPSPIPTPVIDKPVEVKKVRDVLLLYSREDGSNFMKTMKHFRNLLKSANCNVMDCWDSKLMHKVSANDDSWLTTCFDSEDVQIILINTECSRLRERTFLNMENISYKKPHPLDNIFINGLNYLSNCPDLNNISVVILEEVQNINDAPKLKSIYLKQAKMFCFPNQIKRLLSALHKLDNYNNEIVLKDPEAMEQLIESVKEYQDYIKCNRLYLNSVFDFKPHQKNKNLL